MQGSSSGGQKSSQDMWETIQITLPQIVAEAARELVNILAIRDAYVRHFASSSACEEQFYDSWVRTCNKGAIEGLIAEAADRFQLNLEKVTAVELLPLQEKRLIRYCEEMFDEFGEPITGCHDECECHWNDGEFFDEAAVQLYPAEDDPDVDEEQSAAFGTNATPRKKKRKIKS